jgi:hypothetical protein
VSWIPFFFFFLAWFCVLVGCFSFWVRFVLRQVHSGGIPSSQPLTIDCKVRKLDKFKILHDSVPLIVSQARSRQMAISSRCHVSLQYSFCIEEFTL